MSDYNYSHFPLDMEAEVFAAFPGVLPPGGRAVDGTLTDADSGQVVRLKSLWKSGVGLLIEFGSAS